MDAPNLVALVLTTIVAKRMLVGPLPVYARTAALLSALGIALMALAGGPQEPLAFIGAYFVLLSLTVLAAMFGAEVLWIARHRRMPWGGRGRRS